MRYTVVSLDPAVDAFAGIPSLALARDQANVALAQSSYIERVVGVAEQYQSKQVSIMHKSVPVYVCSHYLDPLGTVVTVIEHRTPSSYMASVYVDEQLATVLTDEDRLDECLSKLGVYA